MTLSKPKDKTFSKGFFPFGLVLLTVTFLVVFLTVQLNDNKYRNEAIQYYFQHDIDKVEFPLYVKFMRKYMRDDFYYHQLENITNGKMTDMELYWIQRTDPFFQSCLNTDQCLTANTLTYLNWQEKRREYLHLLDKISFHKYGFKPGDPSAVNIITNLFVNPDLYQFVINLIFILIICAIVEKKIGVIGLLMSYLVCGLSMVSIYCLLTPFSLIAVSGASGGIAGLIGMVLVFSKLGNVNILYFNKREFHTKAINSVGIFIFWNVCQLCLVYFTAFDIVGYISQLVAFLVGVLLAMMLQKLLVHSTLKTVKHADKPTDLQSRLNDAVKEISQMNYNEAKKILYPLLVEYPANKEIYFQLFNIVKSNPASEEYHDIAQKIFLIKDSSRSTVAMINLVFKNYIRRAQPTIRFDVDTFISLLSRFRKAGFYDDAEKILKVLIKHNNDDMLSEVLAREQLLLARCYLLKKDKVHGDRLLEWLVETFPNTESAKQAKSFVDIKNSGTYY